MMLETMLHRVFSSRRYLPALRRCRLSAIFCALIILWAGFDSQVLLLASAACLPPTSPIPSPIQDDDDDDDYVLDLTGKPALGPSLRRNARPPSPKRQWLVTSAGGCFAHSSPRQLAPPTSAGEHAFRNGIGAPLLC
jgi:hypothetical protein